MCATDAIMPVAATHASAACKALLNTAVEPLRISGTLATYQILSGGGLRGAIDAVRRELWTIYQKSIFVWTPLFWYCYRYLPPVSRLPLLYFVGAFYDTFISYVANRGQRSDSKAQ